MSKFILSTSSCADLTESYAKEHNIVCLPFTFLIEGKEYPDDFGHSMSYTDFYTKVRAGEPSTTSMINAEAYEEYFKSFSDASYEALASGSGLVVAGGFCTYLPGIVGGIQRALGKGKKLGIVYLDAHADIETPEMTRSHIVAGLPVASIVGIGLKEWYDVCGITEPVDSENFILTDYHARSYACLLYTSDAADD